MKLTIASSDFNEILSRTSKAINTNATLPVLQYVLVELKGDILTLNATDLETTITCRKRLTTGELKDGSVLLEAKPILDTIKLLPDQPLTFTVEKTQVRMSCFTGEYLFGLGGEPSEFPKPILVEKPKTGVIPGMLIERASKKVLPFVGNDELRPNMAGVYLQLAPNDIRFVATDAHRLSKMTYQTTGAEKEAGMIIPSKPFKIVSELIDLKKEVRISYNDSNLMFSSATTRVSCRLIDGKYPNYEAVIPSENPYRLQVEKAKLMACIKRVSIYANRTTHQVVLSMKNNALKVSAEDLDFSSSANESLQCSFDGELTIGFNSKFLLATLATMDTKVVQMEFSAANRAAIITPDPTEENNPKDSFMGLVMPVMLNQ